MKLERASVAEFYNAFRRGLAGSSVNVALSPRQQVTARA